MAVAFACNPCATSDPTTDTFQPPSRVSLPAAPTEDKENVTPQRDDKAEQMAKEQAARERAEAEEEEARRQAEEAAERCRAEAEAKARAEAAAQAEAERVLEEERRLAAEEAAAEAARQEAERERKAEEERKVSEYLASHGFKDVNKKSKFKSQYPLHVAVKEQDAEMVRLLISAGADRTLKNRFRKMPWQEAKKVQHAEDKHKKVQHVARGDVRISFRRQRTGCGDGEASQLGGPRQGLEELFWEDAMAEGKAVVRSDKSTACRKKQLRQRSSHLR